jgi:CRISPR/Cas system-associated exonuclease Cas4 (RecB family)
MTAETTRIGVTSAGTLLGCRLRVQLDRSTRTSAAKQPTFNAPAVLGDICHAALQQIVESRAILGPDWEAATEEAWEMATAKITAETGVVDLTRLSNHDLARARTFVVAGRLGEMLAPLGPEVELTCEQPMSALDGRLLGQPDLVARNDSCHWIVDYKTGGVLEWGTQVPRASYRSQLRLYAVLEHERSGIWPDLAFLLPYAEATVEVAIAPEECRQLAYSLGQALEAFDERSPEPQPASPDPDTCRWCSHATACEAVWQECGEEWSPEVLLAEGRVLQAARAATGSGTVVLELERGTIGVGQAAIRVPAGEEMPVLAPGSRARASGLQRRGERTFALTGRGVIAEVAQ